MLKFSQKNHKNNEYPGLTKKQYADKALELIQKKATGRIRGYVRKTGQIVRYDRVTKDLVIGYNKSDGVHPEGIATMFKASEQYYNNHLKKEAFGDDYS